MYMYVPCIMCHQHSMPTVVVETEHELEHVEKSQQPPEENPAAEIHVEIEVPYM